MSITCGEFVYLNEQRYQCCISVKNQPNKTKTPPQLILLIWGFFQTFLVNYGNVLNYCITLPPNRQVFQHRTDWVFMHHALVEVSEDYTKNFTHAPTTLTLFEEQHSSLTVSATIKLENETIKSTAKHPEQSSKLPWSYSCWRKMHQNSKRVESLDLQWISQPSCGSQNSSIHSLYPTTLGSDRSWQEVLGLLHSLGPDYLPKGSATATRKLFRHTEKQVNPFEEDHLGVGLPGAYYYFSLTPIFSFTAHIVVKMPLCKKTLHTR